MTTTQTKEYMELRKLRQHAERVKERMLQNGTLKIQEERISRIIQDVKQAEEHMQQVAQNERASLITS